MVTKSAVKNTLATPSSASRSPRYFFSGDDPLTCVPGPPTGRPTVNLIAFGLGVFSTRTAIETRA